MHAVQRCGLLLPMFCGLCFCVSVCWTNPDAVWGADLGMPKEPCIIIIFLTPVLSSQGMKKNYAMQYKKYKNQAGMNLTPPPSQNSHAVRWHCTAESERRVAEIKS